jgi:stage III sporulation protein AA
MYKGIPQNDVGIRTDVLDNIPKSIGMKMLIRSMAPKVISADEIGSTEDIEPINYAICSGIKGIFTAHGSTLEEISINPTLKKLLSIHVFERIIFLNDKKQKAGIEYVYNLNKKTSEYSVME